MDDPSPDSSGWSPITLKVLNFECWKTFNKILTPSINQIKDGEAARTLSAVLPRQQSLTHSLEMFFRASWNLGRSLLNCPHWELTKRNKTYGQGAFNCPPEATVPTPSIGNGALSTVLTRQQTPSFGGDVQSHIEKLWSELTCKSLLNCPRS